jgi:hypothetical protein
MSLVGIVAGIAAILAIIVTSVIIGVCLLVSWMTDAFRSDRGRPQQGVRGGGRHTGQAPRYPGRQAGPPFPSRQPGPPFPGQQAAPQYPGQQAAPQYPQAAPQYPPQQPQDPYRRAGRLRSPIARSRSIGFSSLVRTGAA